MVASTLLSMALAPKAQNQPPAAFEDFEFPQADEGTPEAVFFGDCWTSDWTVLAVGNYQTEAIRKSS
jgi:hypothetical protein